MTSLRPLSTPKARDFTRWSFIRLLLFLSVVVPFRSDAQQMERVAELAVWPAVSQLIAYNDRIWFVNSQPYKDTNAADIYSYSPASEKLRYERSLFTQDAGNPAVFEGLLYWPFEDPRRSAGTGEYAVTDGKRWQWHYMQSGSVMHVHAMDVCHDQLVAVTGSWTGQLHTQQPDQQWRLSYDYEAGSASFSRLVNVSEFENTCVIGAAARGKNEAKLFSIDNAKTAPLRGWPVSDRVDGLTVHKRELFAFADTGSDRTLMRFNGAETHNVSLPVGHRPRALHSNGDTLWLVTHYVDNQVNHGRLWVYTSDGVFTLLNDFEHAPVSLTSHRDSIYIGTYHRDGGALWRYTDSQVNTLPVVETAELPEAMLTGSVDASMVKKLYKEISEIVRDPNSTANYARDLRRKIGRHPDIKTAEFGAAVTRLLSDPIDDSEVTMFTQRPLSRQSLIKWYLLTTLAISGYGRVDPDWIKKRHELEDHSSGKLFDPSVAAIVAVGWLGQDDKSTIDALMHRLQQNTDPEWLKADLVGALTVLTRQRFAYDTQAWNQWWKSSAN